MVPRSDNRLLRLLCGAVLAILPTAFAEDLSLVHAMRRALSENRLLQVQRFDEEIAGQRLAEEHTIYDPSLEGGASWARDSLDTLPLSGLRDREDYSGNIGVSKANAIGGSTALNLTLSRTSSRFAPFRTRAEESSASVGLSYTQSLLRGRGRGITELGIRRAETAFTYERQRGEALVSAVLQDVLGAYLSFYLSRESLHIREEILRNTREILQVIREKYSLRAISVIDLRKIESVALEQERDILSRREAMQAQANSLQFAISTRIEPGRYESVTPRLAFTRLLTRVPVPGRDSTLRLARQWDQDLIALRRERALLEHDLTQALDRRRSDLSLTTSVAMRGFADNAPYHSLSDLDPGNYAIGFELGLRLPVGKRAARLRVTQIGSAMERNSLRLGNRENQVRKALAEHRLRLERIRSELALNEKLVELTKQNLEAEVGRLRGGQSTLLDTLVFQSDHFDAKLAVVRSQVEYLMVLGRLYAARNDMRAFLDE